MEFVHSAEELGHIFSIATEPAFFLGAIAAFLSLILNWQGLIPYWRDLKKQALSMAADMPLLTSKAK